MAYLTIKRFAQSELTIKKSRFLGSAAPVRSAEDALTFIERIRSAHREATHNCFAFKAGGVQRLSDDGEPSGTAGRPIFDVIEKQGLSDLVIVVTRYFGGILLGAGGLVRAYSQAAAAVVEAAGTAAGALALQVRIVFDYPMIGKVQHLLQQCGGVVRQTDFATEVIMECLLLAAHVNRFASECAEISAGRIQVERLQEVRVDVDLNPL